MKYIFRISCLIFLLPHVYSGGDVAFDFIVVGGGTAGCAVASRLSENGRYTVLLLEKGIEPTSLVYVPAVSRRAAVEGGFWKTYPTVPQVNAALENNGIVIVNRGETLGGTSAINGMNFNRGSPQDYNQWAEMTGDESWTYSNLLRNYFKKIENYTGDFPSDQHGVGGPITISRPRYAPGMEVLLQAGIELGFPIADQNGPQRVSFTPVEFAKKLGRRVTSYSGYIQPILGSRPNLKILTNVQVIKIQIIGNKAVGVIYTSINSTTPKFYAAARKEIVICAGYINSPVLLMKSGIGPKEVLDAAKITPKIKYLPVGRSLQDHPIVKMIFALNNSLAVTDPARDWTPENFRIFNEFGDGPFSNRDGQTSQAFMVSPKTESITWPDIQVIGFFSPENIAQENLGQLRNGEVAMSTNVFVGRPKSRGVISLNTTHVNGVPLIDFRYLTHPDDMDVLVNAIKSTLKIFEETTSFQQLGARWLPSPVLACRHLKFRSDDYWRCYIRQKASTGHHHVGSCRMGKGQHDLEAVVDPTLKVIGIQGLRVADASVMPAVTNANTMAPTYLIAEKASDMILRAWEPKY